MRARPATVALLAVLATALLGACQESGFDERRETARPLKVQHVLGETKVPGQAQRPLTLTPDALDGALTLGVQPVRAALPGGRAPSYLRGDARGVPTGPPPSSAAEVAQLERDDPDVILGSDAGQGRLYEDLSRVAPTVMTEGGGGQWKLNVRLIGEGLGRTNDAERALIDYDAAAARTRQAIRSAAAGREGRPRVAVARLTADGLRYAARDSFAATILADAGLELAGRAGATPEVTLLSSGSAPSGERPAGRIVRVDSELWWGAGGILAARAALADLRRALR